MNFETRSQSNVPFSLGTKNKVIYWDISKGRKGRQKMAKKGTGNTVPVRLETEKEVHCSNKDKQFWKRTR